MKYRLKYPEIEAVQWDGANLQDIRLLLNSGEIDATPMGFIYFWGAGALNATRPGDWIVKLANGDFCLYEDAEFRELYEPVTEPETCVWTPVNNGEYESSCHFIQVKFIDCRFCPKCGRKIEERS